MKNFNLSFNSIAGRLKEMARPKKATSASSNKTVKTSAVIQYHGLEFKEADCLKKAQAQFKKDYKGVELTGINIYIKPEEHRIYYVANGDKVGSTEL